MNTYKIFALVEFYHEYVNMSHTPYCKEQIPSYILELVQYLFIKPPAVCQTLCVAFRHIVTWVFPLRCHVKEDRPKYVSFLVTWYRTEDYGSSAKEGFLEEMP
jgi:hypothetical protein